MEITTITIDIALMAVIGLTAFMGTSIVEASSFMLADCSSYKAC